MEDVIKDAKNRRLRAFFFHSFGASQAWCLAMTLLADLLAWLRLLALGCHAQFRTAAPATLRQRLLKVPAQLVRRARKRLTGYPGATDLTLAWSKVRALSTAASPPRPVPSPFRRRERPRPVDPLGDAKVILGTLRRAFDNPPDPGTPTPARSIIYRIPAFKIMKD
ncbi:hypothetical protein ACFOY2_15310 [Nonomuraea purpurea]|uniref:Transposase DDE domain-containing protein n=1 Tax=Nonomuraea purpurea TaxID=1849276 RepID=A0ABV8G3Q5_9ACTN